MESVRGVLTAIALLAGCTSVSVGKGPKWTAIVQSNGGHQEESPPVSERKAAV
jgi:hypothetical protein